MRKKLRQGTTRASPDLPPMDALQATLLGIACWRETSARGKRAPPYSSERFRRVIDVVVDVDGENIL
jgi:hypothetical protein